MHTGVAVVSYLQPCGAAMRPTRLMQLRDPWNSIWHISSGPAGIQICHIAPATRYPQTIPQFSVSAVALRYFGLSARRDLTYTVHVLETEF